MCVYGMKSERKASSPLCCMDEGVFMEILLCLPVKSVITFQLVCKSWLSLISSNYFRRLHTLHRRPGPPPSLAVATREWQLISPNPKMTLSASNPKVTISYSNPITTRTKKMNIIPFDINNFEMLSCSNGLMLLQCKDCSDYYIYNPTTKQSKIITPPKNEKFNRVLSIHLVFDPSKSPHYKIICIRMEEEEALLLHQIEVFDSGSGAWRVCVEPFTTNDEIMNFTACVECKNFIYLIINHIYVQYVYLFDIVKKDSDLIVCPVPELAEAAYSHSIQASNDCVYYCALLKDGPCKSSVALWELQVNENDPRCSNWLLKYRQRVPRLDGIGFDILTFIAETTTVLIHAPGKIVAYNFLRRSYKKILGLNYNISSVKIFKFGETLALI